MGGTWRAAGMQSTPARPTKLLEFQTAERSRKTSGNALGSRPAAAGPSAGRDCVLVPRPRDRSPSPKPSLIKGENPPFASRTPWRRGDARPPCQGFLGFLSLTCVAAVGPLPKTRVVHRDDGVLTLAHP